MTSVIGGLIGGSLIGLSAAILLLGCGTIMGASNILISLLTKPKSMVNDSTQQWKILFLLSFISTANILTYINLINSNGEARAMQESPDRALLLKNGPFVSNFGIAIAGLCTGFGTHLSNGCTTGHGICGMARFSLRSTAAALTFMGVGIATSSILSTNIGLFRCSTPMMLPTCFTALLALAMIAAFLYVSYQVAFKDIHIENDDEEKPLSETTSLKQVKNGDQEDNATFTKEAPYALMSGALFALGLNVSQMIDNQVVLNFLDFSGMMDGTWDPTLAYVMGSGVIVSALSYQYVQDFNMITTIEKPLQCTLSGGDFKVTKAKDIDSKLLVGAAVFGFGWGIGGYCPGPATYLACVGYPQILFMYMPLFYVGAMISEMETFESL